MTDPATAILLNLIASTIWSAGGKGRTWFEDHKRKNAISENLGDLPTEFNLAIKNRIEEVAKEHDNQELAMIALHWEDEVAENLDSLDAYFGDEKTAIKEITNAIENAASAELKRTDRDELKTIVAKASKQAIQDFEKEIEKADLDDQLNRELSKAVHENSEEALRRLEKVEEKLRWNNRQRYTVFDPDRESKSAVDTVVGSNQIDFVPRPELSQIGLGWTLILGPSGSGKTRLLEGVLQQFDKEKIEHILVPDKTLLTPESVAFDPHIFEGDVLLIWDDLHEITTEGDEKLVPVFIRELEAVLDQQGYQLNIVATTRSGSVDTLPGDVNSKTGIWEEFNQVWLTTPPEETMKEIANRIANSREVHISEDALDRLVRHTKGVGASAEPSYLRAAIETADGKLEKEDIESLPETAKQLWTQQYRKLKRGEIQNGRDIWLVLFSFKLLDQTILPPIASVAEDIFREVLDGGEDRLAFQQAIESLYEWQWIDLPENAEEVVGSFVYDIHAIQIEAVNESLDPGLASSLSDYLLNSLDERDIPWHWNRISVNGRFAVGLPFDDEFIPVKKNHFEQTIELAEENSSNYSHILHNQYGQLLLTQEGPKVAACHYAQALHHKWEYPLGHNNYASSLERRGYEKLAAKHYAIALQHDYNSPTIHSNYAGLLKSRGDQKLAAKHLANSIRIGPNNPLTQSSYSQLQWNRGYKKQATKHAALALQLSYDNPHLHVKYANILKSQGYRKLATKHFALALQNTDISSILHQNHRDILSNDDSILPIQEKYSMTLQPDINHDKIYLEYAVTLGERGYLRKAAQHLALILQQNSKSARINFNYAMCLKRRGYFSIAIKHFALTLQFGNRSWRVHSEYGSMLRLRGDYHKSVKHFALALQSNYENAEIHYNYANALRDRNNHSLAIKHAATALQINRDSPQIHDLYADLLRQRGNLELAKRHIALSLQINYEIGELHYKYAILLTEQNYPRKAINHFKIAMQIGIMENQEKIVQASAEKLTVLLKKLEPVFDWIEEVDNPPTDIPSIEDLEE